MAKNISSLSASQTTTPVDNNNPSPSKENWKSSTPSNQSHQSIDQVLSRIQKIEKQIFIIEITLGEHDAAIRDQKLNIKGKTLSSFENNLKINIPKNDRSILSQIKIDQLNNEKTQLTNGLKILKKIFSQLSVVNEN